MKKVFTLGLIALFLSSCYSQYDSYGRYRNSKNHSGIREWKAGKMKKSNRRSNERPQCIDSW